jgi:hypothetical protein
MFESAVGEKYGGNDIIAFSAAGVSGYVDRNERSVHLAVPHDTEEIVPLYALSAGASIHPEPQSGDFPGTKTYTVKSETGNEKDYTVTIIRTAGIDITIGEPQVWDYTSDTLRLSKSGAGGIEQSITISATDTYTTYIWTVGNVCKSVLNNIELDAADYDTGVYRLQFTVSAGSPAYYYTRNLSFTVIE